MHKRITQIIKKKLHSLAYRIQSIRYMSRLIVFAADLLFSVIATLITLTIVISVTAYPIDKLATAFVVLVSTVTSVGLLLTFRIYRIVIRYATFRDLTQFLNIAIWKGLILFFCIEIGLPITTKGAFFIGMCDTFITFLFMIMARGVIINVYYSLIDVIRSKTKTLVYGTSPISVSLCSSLINDHTKKWNIAGFIDTAEQKKKLTIRGYKLFNVTNEEDFNKFLFNNPDIQNIIFPSQDDITTEKNNLIEFCLKKGIQVLVSPDLQQTDGKVSKRTIKEVKIEDLLNRKPIPVDVPRIESLLKDKCVFVSGAAGSIGSELLRQLINMPIKKLIAFDNAETPLHNLRLEIEREYPNVNIEFVIGNVSSRDRVFGILNRVRPDVIFHAAAYKHVPLMEENPCEAVTTNVLGSLNMAEVAHKIGVEQFIMVSTDKAVNPTNIMGASKRIAEMIVQSLNDRSATCFTTTRFGNVLGSNGSVVPLFRKQIEEGGPVTVTHPDIIRYFMTIPEACNLVLQAATMGKGGEIFVFDMGEQVRIADMARRMIALAGLRPDVDIMIKYTGLRPGEKLYEELLSNAEETSETQHGKIRKAKVIAPEFDEIYNKIQELIRLAKIVNIDETVKLMKELVPEFISKNSKFEAFDSEQQHPND